MLQEIATLTGHVEDRVWHISWSRSGKYLASCGEDKVVRIWTSTGPYWDNKTVHCISTLEDAQSRTIRCCEWSMDDKSIACASFDGTIVIWEAQNNLKTSWEVVTSLEGHENEVKCVSWSSDGQMIASCGRDKTVWIWEKVDRGEFDCVAVFQGKQGHTQDVKSVRWHPSLPLLYSTSYDDTIKIWKEDNGDWYCAETLNGHLSTVWGIAIYSEGNKLVTCSDDKSVILWEQQQQQVGIKSEKWNISCRLNNMHNNAIYSIDWSEYNGYIVTGGGDNSIRLYGREEGGVIDGLIHPGSCRTNAHENDVNCVRWNPSAVYSDLLASAGDDGTVRIWRLLQ